MSWIFASTWNAFKRQRRRRMELKYPLCALGIIVICSAAPFHNSIETDPELIAGFFEGDIVKDEPQNGLRNGIRNDTYQWPNNTVLYYINDHFDDEHRNHILRGMRNIEAVSCIRFVEVTPDQPAYVNITGLSGGCFSSVGFRNTVQSYNLQLYPLDSGCFRIGTIMHELLHTLGFYHMQSSSNRDEFVRIAEENVQDGTLHNFNKYEENTVDDFDEEYDYGSVLHYSAYAFSANGEMTIVPLKEEAAGVMGQRRELSKSDINRLNTMYRCTLDL